MKPHSQDPSSPRRPSDDRSVALPSQRVSLWRCLRSELAWALGTMALTSLSLIPLMRLWRADLRVPFTYTTDTLLYLMTIKSVLKHGWFLENPDLGAPSGQELYDYPVLVGHSFNYVLIKLLGVFSSDPALITNLFFLLSFPLVALASFLVLRQLGVSGATALVCSVIYALAPYHFLRGETHLHLSAYYSVPAGAYLILSLLSRRPLFVRRTGTGSGVLAWASRRSLVTLALCLIISFAGSPYYAVFTGGILIIATVLILVTRRDVRTLVQSSVLLGAIFGFLMLDSLPYLMYQFANGDTYVANRPAEDSEHYGLELTQMILPVPGHQVGALSDLAERYYTNPNQPRSEGPTQSLGFIATLGFAWLLLVALASCLSPRWEIGGLRHRQIATATVIAFLIGTTGGISSLWAYVVSTQIRGWNRISILIAFFAIAAVALLLDVLRERMRVRRGGSVLAGALLLSVLLVGLYDQSNDSFVPDYLAVQSEYTNDALFVSEIDRELPPQAEVFQLPYMSFPEHGPVNELPDFELVKPYLHENDLRWSYGAVKGRPAGDWQAELSDTPTDLLLATVLATGFDGIYIDRFGYPDRAAKLEGELGELLKAEPLVSTDGRKTFFSLRISQESPRNYSSLPSVPVPGTYGYLDGALNRTTGTSTVRRDGQVKVIGWAATPAGSPPLDKVEVKIDGQAVTPVIWGVPREDVADHFGQSARYSGWEVTIDLRDFEVSGPVNIEADAVDVDGGRHPLPKNPNLSLRVEP